MTSERALDWVDGIAHRLIHHAARRAPDSLADRLEEEWLADLASQRGPIQRLRFAFGCCWAINVIAHEHAVAALPVASSPTGQGHFTHHPGGNGDSPFFTARTITFVLVAILHAALLYDSVFAKDGMHLGVGSAISMIVWLTVAIYWLGNLYYNIEGLQAMVLPVAAVSAFLPAIFPATKNNRSPP